MNKIALTIDLNKVDMSKVKVRKYTNGAGQEVEVKELKIDLVHLKEPRFVAEKDTFIVKKVAFLVEPQTKQERESKAKNNFVGDGFVFENKSSDEADEQPAEEASIEYPDEVKSDEPNPDDIPF